MSVGLCSVIAKPHQAFPDPVFASYLCVRNASLKLEFLSEC